MTAIRSSVRRFDTSRFDSLTREEPELEFVCGALGEIGQRGMSVEADSVWGGFIAASVAAICGALARGAQPPG